MKSNSWVIVEKGTLNAIFETFNKSLADKVNTEKYTVLTSYEYLTQFNDSIK